MKFNFKADLHGLLITFTAERIYCSKQHERYRLWIAGSEKYIIIQNNRPGVEAKKDGKPVQWFVAEGKIHDKKAMLPVYKKIEETLDKKPPVVQATLNFINEL